MKMRIVIASLAVLALVACNQAAEPTAETDVAETNAAAATNAATPAEFSLRETTWEFTDEDGKVIQESIDANGNYVASSGSEHIDHGTMAMVDGKACFTSAMNQDGPECWTVDEVAVGEKMETSSDKGKKLTVTRVAYVAPPPMN